MGSAASKSSPKRPFSLRSVAPAAALIFLVLVFVAGAISTLHHNGGGGAVVVVNDWDTSRPWAPPPSSSSRKMLRDDCIGKEQQRRRTPPGVADVMNVAKQRLPRGLAHETTNLEMEASLAGDPRNSASAAAAAPAPDSQQTNKKQKSLLAVPVGIKNKAAVDKLVSKFASHDDQFAVMLFHYDGAVESWSDLAWSRRAVHVSAPGQTKLWFAKRFLHPDVVAEYEYVFLWDEDLEVDSFDPARYLAVVRREGLEVSQPALDRASEIHHAHTARALDVNNGDVHRGAGWVEVMAPVFSRDAWRCAWRMVQNDLIHGWGLDYKLGYCARGDRAVSVGVVDSEYVLHRGVPVLGDGDGGKDNGGRGAVRWRSFKEMQIFQKRWEKAAAEDESWTDPYAAQPPAPSSP
ncbi:hypothetical protein EJB05_12980, partial [Eragrostis curvula]